MAALGHVTRQTIGEVVEEFNEVISPESGIFAQGDEFVRKVLEKALGPAKAQMLMEELQASSYGDLVDILSAMDPKSISNFLSQEHPQAIAVILSQAEIQANKRDHRGIAPRTPGRGGIADCRC